MKKIIIKSHPKYPVPLNQYSPSYCTLTLLDLIFETEKEKIYSSIGASTTCKDFIGDGLFYNALRVEGSTYCHSKELTGPFIVSFTCHVDEVDIFFKQLKLINNFEKKCKIPLTTFEQVGCVVIAIADPFWRESTLAASTFIQLCRFCLTPSKSRSILSQIKAVSVNANVRDRCYAKDILAAKLLDLEFLVKNMNKISGINKFTDYNDEECITNKRSNYSFTRNEIILRKKFTGKVRGGANSHHSNHGICAFARDLQLIVQSREVNKNIATHPFFGRVARYINILPKNRVKEYLHLFE